MEMDQELVELLRGITEDQADKIFDGIVTYPEDTIDDLMDRLKETLKKFRKKHKLDKKK